MFEAIRQLPDDDHYKPIIQLLTTLMVVVIVLQAANILHHWLAIFLKYIIYQTQVNYLREVKAESEEISTVLSEQKEVLSLLKHWYELNRIQTSNQKHIQSAVATEIKTAAANTQAALESIPTQTAQEVVRSISTNPMNTGDSGITKMPPKEDGL